MESIWLKFFLGKTGQLIVSFIDKYYLFLLPFIFAYGIFLTIASLNLKRIRKNVFFDIFRQAKEIFSANGNFNSSSVEVIDKINIDWEKFIKIYSFFPFIINSNNLWVNKVNVFNVRENILPDRNKILEILKEMGF